MCPKASPGVPSELKKLYKPTCHFLACRLLPRGCFYLQVFEKQKRRAPDGRDLQFGGHLGNATVQLF